MKIKQTLLKLIESLEDEKALNDIFDYAMMLTQLDEKIELENDIVYFEEDEDEEHFEEDTRYSIDKLTTMIGKKSKK